MSQERTEQRDRVADMKLVETVEERVLEFRRRANENPVIHRTTGFMLIEGKIMEEYEVATALRYWIGQSDAIDRLNATVAELREEGKKKDTALEVVRTRFGRYVDHSRDYEARLLSRIDEEVAAVKILTAQVQERDREIKRSNEIIAGQDEQINEQAEEIERLQAEVDFARIEFNGIGMQAYVAGADKINRRATEAGERMFAALKGAE